MTATAVKLDASHVRFREAGYWLDKTVDQLLTEGLLQTLEVRRSKPDHDLPERDDVIRHGGFFDGIEME